MLLLKERKALILKGKKGGMLNLDYLWMFLSFPKGNRYIYLPRPSCSKHGLQTSLFVVKMLTVLVSTISNS